MKTKTTFVAYLRQSTQKQENSGLGIEAQREIIQKYISTKTANFTETKTSENSNLLESSESIKMRDFEESTIPKNPILAEFIETESGKSTSRPKLAEALELCRKTNSILIVAKLDRLSRNVAFTSKLLEAETEIIFCDFPEANKLVLHIIASIAEYEAALISQRTRQSLAAKKARGTKLGRPQNLLSDLTSAIKKSNTTNRQKALDNPNNRRAAAYLRTLATSQNATTPQTISAMARTLNAAGFTTATGKSFHHSQVSTLISRYQIPLTTP